MSTYTEADLVRILAQPGYRVVGEPLLMPAAPSQCTATHATAKRPYWPYDSRTEQRYALLLDHRLREGIVQRWVHQPLKLDLGEKCFYTPDFLVIETAHPSVLRLVETKGAYVREDAMVKLKVAAKQHPYFVFVYAQWKDEVWTEARHPERLICHPSIYR